MDPSNAPFLTREKANLLDFDTDVPELHAQVPATDHHPGE